MDGTLLKDGERKVPYDIWKEVVVREGMKCKAVRVFTELREKDLLTALYLDDGEVKRRETKLKPIHVSTKGVIEGNLKIFDGFLRTGDVIDVDEGGTIWYSTVRYGLVCE